MWVHALWALLASEDHLVEDRGVKGVQQAASTFTSLWELKLTTSVMAFLKTAFCSTAKCSTASSNPTSTFSARAFSSHRIRRANRSAVAIPAPTAASACAKLAGHADAITVRKPCSLDMGKERARPADRLGVAVAIVNVQCTSWGYQGITISWVAVQIFRGNMCRPYVVT